MKFKLLVLFMVVLYLPGCTWVEVTEEGSEVMLVKDINVTACKKLATTTSTVKHKVGPITRDPETVMEELTNLAKNRAAELGGDSIVAKEPEKDGSMSFDIYKCAE